MAGGGGPPGGPRASNLTRATALTQSPTGESPTSALRFPHRAASVLNFLLASVRTATRRKTGKFYEVDIQGGVLSMMHRLYQSQDDPEHHMLLQEDSIIPTEITDTASPSPLDKYLIRCFKHELAKVIAGVMLVSTLITALAAPLTFIWGATWEERELVPGGTKILVIDVFMDLVFLMTCLLSLNTSYMDPKYRMEVLDRRKILKRCVSSKFYVWLIFTATCHFWTSVARAPMLINVVKITRMWLLFDLPDALIWWRDRRRYRFGRLVLLVFAGSHCVACLLAWGTGYRETAEEQGYDQFETNFNGETISGWHSLYWMALVESVFLLTGGLDNPVGDGSLRDRNFGSLVFVTIMGPVGCLVVAILISHVTREQTLKYALDMHHEEKKAFMRSAMEFLMIPDNLQRRVFSLHYFQRMSHDKLALTELLKSDNLSKPLELSLRLFIYRRVVMSGFFDTTHQNYILEVVRVLEDHIYIPGDYVCRRGEMGAEMFFVNQGQLDVLVPGAPPGTEEGEDVENAFQLPFKKKPGEYFGEIVLIRRSCPRTAWVRADGYVVCAVLTRDNIETIWTFFPCEREKVVKNVTKTINKDRWRTVKNKARDMRGTMAKVKRAGTMERPRFGTDLTQSLPVAAAATGLTESLPVAASASDGAACAAPDRAAARAAAPVRLSFANVHDAIAAESSEAAAALEVPEDLGPRGLDETCALILEGQKAIQAQIADVARRQAALEAAVHSRGAAPPRRAAPAAGPAARGSLSGPAAAATGLWASLSDADSEAREPCGGGGAAAPRARAASTRSPRARRRVRLVREEPEGALPRTPRRGLAHSVSMPA